MLRTALVVASLSALAVASCQSSSSGPAAPASTTPCGDYYDALDNSPCSNGPTLPASEVARLRGRFEQICQSGVALPGSGLTDGTLEACASAVESAGCAAGPVPAACNITGTLPAGAACNQDFQCQSGGCFQSLTPGEAGASDSCATCLPIAQLGQPCTTVCPPGATCDHSMATPTCVQVMLGDAGATCDGQALQCGTGLYCNNSATCAVLPAAGQPCTTNGLCAAPAACVGPTCEPPGATGSTCEVDFTCAAGLGCGAASQTCGAVTWASAGQPCGDLVRCLVGDCNGGICSTVIADGQACTVGDTSSTCDTFAQCQGGTCVLQDSQVCR
jgi:hypothetical protein